MDTSTPATTPPESDALPLIVTAVPSVRFAPAAGDVMCDVGAVVSVERLAATRPDMSVAG